MNLFATLAVGLALLFALVLAIRALWKNHKNGGGCMGCSGCSGEKPSACGSCDGNCNHCGSHEAAAVKTG